MCFVFVVVVILQVSAQRLVVVCEVCALMAPASKAAALPHLHALSRLCITLSDPLPNGKKRNPFGRRLATQSVAGPLGKTCLSVFFFFFFFFFVLWPAGTRTIIHRRLHLASGGGTTTAVYRVRSGLRLFGLVADRVFPRRRATRGLGAVHNWS